jgi:hypothetical protein
MRPLVQQRMTQTIADLIEKELESSGVAVVIEAEHSCISIRGIRKPRTVRPMIIKKKYKFYAAHRNEELQDKCRNLHGHRYEVRCFFRTTRKGSISTLFGAFDDRIEPFLKREYDHGMPIHVDDRSTRRAETTWNAPAIR